MVKIKNIGYTLLKEQTAFDGSKNLKSKNKYLQNEQEFDLKSHLILIGFLTFHYDCGLVF